MSWVTLFRSKKVGVDPFPTGPSASGRGLRLPVASGDSKGNSPPASNQRREGPRLSRPAGCLTGRSGRGLQGPPHSGQRDPAAAGLLVTLPVQSHHSGRERAARPSSPPGPFSLRTVPSLTLSCSHCDGAGRRATTCQCRTSHGTARHGAADRAPHPGALGDFLPTESHGGEAAAAAAAAASKAVEALPASAIAWRVPGHLRERSWGRGMATAMVRGDICCCLGGTRRRRGLQWPPWQRWCEGRAWRL